MIKRAIFPKLKDHLSEQEITLLVGPRQTGKTYLMKLLEREVVSRGQMTIFLNLDLEKDKRFFESQESLLAKLRVNFGETEGVVFIDEIQRRQDAGLFLKGIYDLGLPYKFIVSGSGSLELKEKIHESLAGRKRVFEINPISFEEFINFKTDYKYEDRFENYFDLENENMRFFLEEYLSFGGYPRVILSPTAQEKTMAINELYRSYLERDITFFLRLEKPAQFTNLVKIMSSQVGSLANISELSSTLGIAAKTVENYLWYLEKTFILQRVTPYFRNVRKEITKAPMFYFKDIGLCNFALEIFGVPLIPSFSGHLFENFVFNLLKNKLVDRSTQIHFWRSRDNAEVDFVLEAGARVIPIEVKYKIFKKPTVGRSLHSFLTHYEPETAYVIHLGKKFETKIGKTTVIFLPYWSVSTEKMIS